MMTRTLRRISIALESLSRQNISIERSLDLLEASTQNLEEIIAINTMRESMQEAGRNRPQILQRQQRTQGINIPFPINVALYRQENIAN